MSAETEYLSVTDTAKIIRQALKRAFPGVTFGVRSSRYSGGASINVDWIDGPKAADVKAIADGFQGGGFDGMIDMAFSVDHWLMPDGSTKVAYTTGTEGSRGTYARIDNPKPHPEARRVHFGSTFVFTNRRKSEAFLRRCVDKVAAESNGEFDPAEIEIAPASKHSGAYLKGDRLLSSGWHAGMYLGQACYRVSVDMVSAS